MDVSKFTPWRTRGFVLTLTMLTASGCAGKSQGRMPGVVVVDTMQANVQAGPAEVSRGQKRHSQGQQRSEAGTAESTESEFDRNSIAGNQLAKESSKSESSGKSFLNPLSSPVSPAAHQGIPASSIQSEVVTALKEVSESPDGNSGTFTSPRAEQQSSREVPQALFSELPGPEIWTVQAETEDFERLESNEPLLVAPSESAEEDDLRLAPPPIMTGGITLDQAIASTMQNDPVLRAGFQVIRQAQADRVTAGLRPNPELEITQTLLPLTNPFIADVREGGPPQLDIMLTYPIDWYLFGKRSAAILSAQREVQVNHAEYEDLIRQRVLETSLAYYDVLEARALVELARQDVENLSEVERITRIGVENGALPEVEFNRIKLDRLSSQQTLRETERDLVAAQASLAALMGRSAADGSFDLAGELSEPIEMAIPDVPLAIAEAESNRPDINALRWRISQAQAETVVQEREKFPEVTPMIGYTRQFQSKAIGFPDANSWGIGLSMGLPISDRNQGNRMRARSEWIQAGQELQAALLELGAEITSLTAELKAARENLASTTEEQLELSERVRDSIRQAYEAGGRPLIDVLDSQRNFRETYANYITSRADYWRAVVQYNAALGTKMLR